MVVGDMKITDAMVEAGIRAIGEWMEPYTAPRESGVALDGDITAEDAVFFNLEAIERSRPFLSAALLEQEAEPVPGCWRARIEPAWHEARNAWFKHNRHFTQKEADKAAVDVLIEALAAPVAAQTREDVIMECGKAIGRSAEACVKAINQRDEARAILGEINDIAPRFIRFVDIIENRSMAADGPVTPFLEELASSSQAEKEKFTTLLSDIYSALRALLTNPAKEGE